MEIITLFFALVMILSGIGLNHYISIRWYNRRNIAGMHQFSSYKRGILINKLEKLGKIIAWMLIVIGLFLFIYYYSKTEEIYNE